MTPMPATSTPITTPDYTAIAKRHKDGSVLLSIADDRICKLNGVGALTWMILEETPVGLTIGEVVERLSDRFEAINREGELRYEVSPEQLHEDTARFLENMAQINLLAVTRDSRSPAVYHIREGVTGTTSTTVAAATNTATSADVQSTHVSPLQSTSDTTVQPETNQHIGTVAAVEAEDDVKVSRRETFIAFIGLAAFDLLLKLSGFQALIQRVERWPTVEPRTTDPEVCKRVRAMVDRAQMYYPKKAMCLQHSAVVTCLLRRRGVPAEMVLAACDYPPEGHAWAEVEGEVVNDSQKVKDRYRQLRRV